MIFEHSVRIPATRAVVWDFLMNVPEVATCIPGTSDVVPSGENTFGGKLKVRVGPVALTMTGEFEFVRTDPETGEVDVEAKAADKRIGGSVAATMQWRLVEVTPTETDLNIRTDVTMLGKLGEFGQPLIRKKSDQILEEFAENLREKLGS